MKISVNWLKKYVDIKIPDDELIRLIGARLVEVEGIIDETHKYDNIYVVKVEKAEKIPNTHLTICQINDGGDELIQVVCGAPNVREGMLAVWIKPGATVPVSVHEDAPFVIGKRKMLGQYDSNGMLAGADELDFGGKHDKIAEIDPAIAKPGDLLANVFELNDLILEIENKSLTHRPDCFGIIGFAREVAGILGEKFEEPEFLLKEEVFPEGFLKETKSGMRSAEGNLEVEITDSVVCPRYTCAVLKVDEAISEYKYLSETKILLAKSGMQTVSRIVDITNYLMLLTGQPLHAFDFDRFVAVGGNKAPKVLVRSANKGEKIELIDGKIISCNESDILITSSDVPVAMAGAMGGKNTEIDENTKNILLESATFSLYNLRKTQMAHGIFSEAITRFTKGVPTGGTFVVLAEAIKEMNGKPLEVQDAFPGIKMPTNVCISVEEINDLLGTNYSKELMAKTLENVGFKVNIEGNLLKIVAPCWRTDIGNKEDIIEEIGRLLGYDNIQPTLPLHATAEKNKMFELKREIRDLMSKFGANELLTYTFVSEHLLKKAGLDVNNSYKIVNSISPELQYVRQSIVPSLLDKVYVNQKIPVDRFALYEMNKACQKKEWGLDGENVPIEKTRIGFVLAERKNHDTPYYKAKLYVAKLLDELGISSRFLPLKAKGALALPFEPKRAAEIWVGEKCIGVVGEFKKSVQHEFKLADYLAGFEVDLESILECRTNEHKVQIVKTIERDLTVVTDKNYAEVVSQIETILKENDLDAKITAGTIYQPEGEDKKHITLHLSFIRFDESVMKKLEKL